MAARLGFGSSASRARADSIMPGWQKPHCSAPQRSKASWTGSTPLPPAARWSGRSPSMVVTSLPCASAARVRQASTGAPSTRTVHAPQSPLSQPCLEPVRPSL